MKVQGDPVDGAIDILDLRPEKDEVFEIEEDDLEGISIPKLKVVLETATGEEKMLHRVTEPREGSYEINSV